MDAKRTTALAAALAFGLAAASAQDADERVAVLDEYERSIAFADYLGRSDLRASELIGSPVLDERGSELGQIDDLIVSRDDEIVSVLVSVGGFLGVGDKQVAIPYEELKVSPETRELFLAMGEEQLMDLPEYRSAESDLDALGDLRERAVGESSAERRRAVSERDPPDAVDREEAGRRDDAGGGRDER